MTRVDSAVQQYAREGLVALLPAEFAEGCSTVVHTLTGRHGDSRSLPWLIRRIAAYYGADLGTLRRQYGAILQRGHHIPLPFTQELILLPVKTRLGAGSGETTLGYVNYHCISEVKETKGDFPYRSFLQCRGGLEIKSLHKVETLQERLRQGRLVQQEYRHRRRETVTCRGIDPQQILELLPECRCLLRDVLSLVVSFVGDKHSPT